jgi:RNA recognition motif-containing protein
MSRTRQEAACSFCGDKLSDPLPLLLPCGHAALCAPCLQEAVEEADGAEIRCPQCMAVVDTDGSHASKGTLSTDAHARVVEGMGQVPAIDMEVLTAYGISPLPSPGQAAGDGDGDGDEEDVEQDGRIKTQASSSSSSSSGMSTRSSRADSEDERADPLTQSAARLADTQQRNEQVVQALLHRLQQMEGKDERGLDHLDPYAYEGLGADFTSTGEWVQPDITKAQDYAAQNIHAGGTAKLLDARDEDFASSSVGASLFLKLQKYLLILLSLAVILNIPLMLLASVGHRIPTRLMGSFSFAYISLGNIGPEDIDAARVRQLSYLGNTTGTTAASNATVINTQASTYADWLASSDFGLGLSGSASAIVLPLFDAFAAIFMLVCVFVFRHRLQTAAVQSDNGVSAADFTVVVKGLPHDTTEKEVADHFSFLFALDGSGVTPEGRLPLALKRSSLKRIEPAAPIHPDTDGITRGRLAPLVLDEETSDVSKETNIMDNLRKGVVESASHSGSNTCVGSWVADVHLVSSDGNVVSNLLTSKLCMSDLRNQRALYKMYAAPRKGKEQKEQQEVAKKRAQQLEFDLLEARAKVLQSVIASMGCNGTAFVTFNNEESFQRCLLSYRGSNVFAARLFQTRALRLASHGKWYRILVERAPDPSDMLHQNLACSENERQARTCFTAFLTLVLLAIGFVCMIVAQSYTAILMNSVPDFSLCDSEIPSLYTGSYSIATAARQAVGAGYGTLLTENNHLRSVLPESPLEHPATASLALWRPKGSVQQAIVDNACGSSRMSMVYRYDFSHVPSNASWLVGSAALPVYGQVDNTQLIDYYSTHAPYYMGTFIDYGIEATACDTSAVAASYPDMLPGNCPDPRRINTTGQCGCIDKSTSVQCQTLSCFTGENYNENLCRHFPLSTVVGCYCLHSLATYVDATSNAVQGFVDFAAAEGSVCATFVQIYTASRATVIGTTIISAVVNVVLGIAIPLFITWERHISVSAQTQSTILKITASQLLNTLVTIIVVNAKADAGPVAKSIGLLDGQYPDFTTAWYTTVGASICLTSAISIALSVFTAGMGYVRFLWLRKSVVEDPTLAPHQQQLNAAFVGPAFPIERKYPAIIVQVISATLYGSGMPILYVFALVFCVCSYVLDKWLMLRFYQKPLHFPRDAPMRVLDIVMYSLVAHSAVGLWMFTADSILPVTGLGSTSALQDIQTSSIPFVNRVFSTQMIPLLLCLITVVVIIFVQSLYSFFSKVARLLFRLVCCGGTCLRKKQHGGQGKARLMLNRVTTKKFTNMDENEPGATETAIIDMANAIVANATAPATPATLPLGTTLSLVVPKGILIQMLQAPAVMRSQMVLEAFLRHLFANGASRVHGRSSGLGKGLVPFTETFGRLLGQYQVLELSSVMQGDGWELQRLEVDTLRDVSTDKTAVAPNRQIVILRKRRRERIGGADALSNKEESKDGETESARLPSQYLKTWELAAESGTHSYDYRYVPQLQQALKAVLENLLQEGKLTSLLPTTRAAYLKEARARNFGAG